ncbi:hypothetical protein LX15_001980 [Streptoalloteichus tenebrarius]|uniref:Uncharacterized protein n=1 Tax=Streptoalloteichus tenebrarius (strain ATCC 17920 / DSM 40477 / JCM 4838 / CBS 697.72 / NBRC 16177 / NCIMB 11028 / NRRL B-12390 / A12253. 1 / ISP 5477) TaxID=1933 RepID=A0ABT1HRZ1_STRSD|nr:Imm1 family immunity protein [Streptoalloteichus tenebrarius]MCP2258286.1 hypothetical protein [Streptoalloteichus tenebrarius]BFF04481.1 hypothetical protein GCM10020241_61560 [Streptoalloteichus tenebrarius]
MGALKVWYDEHPLVIRTSGELDSFLDRMKRDTADGPVPPMAEMSTHGPSGWALAQLGINATRRGFFAYADPGGSTVTFNGDNDDATGTRSTCVHWQPVK